LRTSSFGVPTIVAVCPKQLAWADGAAAARLEGTIPATMTAEVAVIGSRRRAIRAVAV
jgi:hypothetical protein